MSGRGEEAGFCWETEATQRNVSQERDAKIFRGGEKLLTGEEDDSLNKFGTLEKHESAVSDSENSLQIYSQRKVAKGTGAGPSVGNSEMPLSWRPLWGLCVSGMQSDEPWANTFLLYTTRLLQGWNT